MGVGNQRYTSQRNLVSFVQETRKMKTQVKFWTKLEVYVYSLVIKTWIMRNTRNQEGRMETQNLRDDN
jgi:hypothetical protein